MKSAITNIFIMAALICCSMGSCHNESHSDSDAHNHAVEKEHDDKDGHEDHDHEGENHEAEPKGHDHDGAIVLDAHQAESFGVVVEEIHTSPFTEAIRVSGQIEPSATSRHTITARRSGIVTLSKAAALGASVSAGTTVATISSKGIQGGDVNAVAIATREAARRELDRLRSLHADGLVTTAVLNEAQKAYNEAAAAVGTNAGAGSESAGFSGVISAVFVSSGDYVETGAPLAQITRDARLTLRADVPERYADIIAIISSANFRPDSSKEYISISDVGGTLLSKGSLNPAVKGYIPVYFSFNSNFSTHPGSFAEIFLLTGQKGNVLSVSREALVEMQGNYYAYVKIKGDNDTYEKRLVKTGGTDGKNFEILEGIREGELVVTKGASIIRMAETSAIAPPGHSHNH